MHASSSVRRHLTAFISPRPPLWLGFPRRACSKGGCAFQGSEDTQFKKVFDSFCERRGVGRDAYRRFYLDGQCVMEDHDTPDTLDWMEDDVIDARRRQQQVDDGR